MKLRSDHRSGGWIGIGNADIKIELKDLKLNKIGDGLFYKLLLILFPIHQHVLWLYQ